MSINKIMLDDVELFNQPAHTQGLDAYQYFATQNANWPGKGTTLGLSYIAGKLNGEAGEMAGQVFKAGRDDNLLIEDTNEFRCYDLTDERRAKITKELQDVLWYVAAMASELNLTLSDVAIGNLENLAGRTERGTLQGDGDR